MGIIRCDGSHSLSNLPLASPTVRAKLAARRRQHLLTAAESVFLSRGYVATTMDDIAQAAGMSKKTIYQVVTSKKELFDELMLDRLAEVTRPPDDTDQPLDEVLRDMLLRLAFLVLSPRHIAMARLVVAEVASSPEVADVLKARCTQGETTLQNWLADQTSRGELVLHDVTDAASMLFSMALGDFHWHLLLGMAPSPSDDAIRRRVDLAVGVFMREFAGPPRDQPAPPRRPMQTARKGSVQW